jgi:sugar O-acyltransferase (sialic acid O-acetyltransferase NeuD family)
MSRLLLVAASGLAREAIEVERLVGRVSQFHVVDDDPATWGTDVQGATVVGGLDLVREYDDHEILVCAGAGPVRRRIVERLTDLGVGPERYARVVHPSLEIPPWCVLGPGTVVLAGVVVTADVAVGSHVVVMPHVTLTHDVVVDDFATLCAGVSLGGGVHVGNGAYLGMNASVRQGTTVGRDAVLGMGAALIDDLPPGECWAGLPARPVTRSSERS